MIFVDKKYHLRRDRDLLIVPVGDIQSAEEYPRLQALVKWLVARKDEGHQVCILGMGDYFESPSPSDRAAIRMAKGGFGFYDELALDIEQKYVQKAYDAYHIFEPLAKDISVILEGHHYLDLLDDKLPRNTTQLLSKLLRTTYGGDTAVVTLSVNDMPFEILATHGYGSGRTPGARLNKRLRMRDVRLNSHWYVMGHDNEKCVYVTEALVGRSYFKQYYSGSGSFQRAYNFDNPKGTYAEKLMLPPTSLGVVICTVRVQRGSNGEPRLDYHVST